MTLFVPVFLVSAGLLALWIDVRFPRLAPESLSRRVLAAAGALLALQVIPILSGSAADVYAGLFGITLPVLITALLAALWMLRALRDAQLSR
jgi:urea transporter